MSVSLNLSHSRGDFQVESFLDAGGWRGRAKTCFGMPPRSFTDEGDLTAFLPFGELPVLV